MNAPPLSSFGRRIMICGPSNTGKSTLAEALGAKLGIAVIHLDRFRHLPDTDWQQRPDAEFRTLHDDAIRADAWVMDGNYSALFPQRIARATGIVLLADNRWANLTRYFRRTLLQTDRVGALDGGRDSVKWAMITWILVNSPRNLVRYRTSLSKTGLPYLDISAMRELKKLYLAWALRPPC